MKKLKLGAFKFFFVFLLLLGTATTSVYAWFSSKSNTISTRVTGSIVFEYFHCGDGSEENPFVITRPIHYYHMVEFFQRITILDIGNNEKAYFGKDYLYFQIGCPLAQLGDPTNTNDPVNANDWYVFDYSNTGGVNEKTNAEGEIVVPGTNALASKTLNMAYYSGERALMPTGSSEVPFLGSIDGHKMTIDNLHIVSTSVVNVVEEDGTIHSNVQRHTADMGVFGCVAQGLDLNEDGSVENVVENDVVTLREQSSIKNLYITNATIDLDGTATSTEIVGDLPTLPNGDSTHSNDYHLVNEDGEVVEENGTEVAYVGYVAGHVFSTDDITDVYVNNCRIVGGTTTLSGYGYFGVIIDPTTGDTVSSLGSAIANIYTSGDGSGFGGSISMSSLYNRINSVRSSSSSVKNITAETVIIDEVAGTTKKIATAYANNNATGPSADSTTSNVNVNYYYDPEAGCYYLLYRNSGTTWYANYLYGETTRLNTKTITTITYEKDPNTGTYKTVDGYKVYEGSSNYLGVNSSFNPVLSTEQNAITLSFDNSNHLYYIVKVPYTQNYDFPFSDQDNSNNSYIDTIYYLNATNTYTGVTTSTNASTTWAFDESNRLYTTNNNTRYYLDYNNSTWYLTNTTNFLIFKDNEGNYLKFTNTTIDDTTVGEDASKIEVSNPGGTTTLSTIINGTRYYLRNNNGTLQLSTTASNHQWSYDSTNEAYYITVGAAKYYLVYYNDSWQMRAEGYNYKISDGSNYLTSTNTTTYQNTTTANDACLWNLNPESATTTISTIIAGTITYLGVNNGALALGTGYSGTIWTKDGNAYYTTINGDKFYLGYENNAWRIGLTGYKISDGTTNYLNASSTTAVNNITSGADNASTWVFDPNAATTEFYTFYSGTKVYLSRNGYNLAVSTSSTTWTKESSNKYYITVDGVKFYLVFKNNAWTLENEGYKISDGTTNYLNASSTTAVNNITSGADNASTWVFDPNAATTEFYTFYSGTKVYLSRNGYNLAASTSSTTWTKESSNKYYLTIDGVKFYLIFKNNSWTIDYEGYKISDGSTNYLRATSQTALGNGTNANASIWILDTSAASTTISTIYSGTKTYLGINNGALALGTGYSGTTWAKDGNGYYVTIAGERAYLIYDSDNITWKVQFDGYKISDGNTNYLRATSQTALGNGTNANASIWFLDTSAASTTISTIFNGTKVYLGINNGALALGTGYSGTTWTKDGSYYYVTDLNEKAYLVYDGEWKLVYGGYKLSNNGQYLRATSATAYTNSTEANASIWFLDLNAASTTISTIFNNSKTYLGINNGALALNASYSSTTWAKDGNGYYVTIAGERAYLIYDSADTSWKVQFDGYKISDGNTNYLRATSQTALGNGTNANASIWFLDTSAASTTIATIFNGTKIYLGINGYSLAINASYSSSSWTKDGSNYYIESNDGIKFYLSYNSGWNLVYDAYKIRSANNGTNYLTANNTTISNSTNGTNFILDPNASSTTISYLNGNTRLYLGIDETNAQTLVLGNGYSNVLWSKDGNLYYTTYSGINYYFTYQYGNWRALPKEYVRFASNNFTMYIQSTTRTSNVASNSATDTANFYADSAGRYYSFYNNTKYYLRNNGGTAYVSNTIGQAATLVRDGNSVYVLDGTNKLYLTQTSTNTGNNGTSAWRFQQLTSYAISDGNGNYLRVTGTNTNSYTNTQDYNQATKFTFSSTTSGRISTTIGNTTYYLRNNNGTLQVSTTSTTWTINESSIVNGTYYLVCDNGTWKLEAARYALNNNGHYLAYTGTNTISETQDVNSDHLVIFSSVPGNTNSSISVQMGNDTYNLGISGTADGSTLQVGGSNTGRWRYNNGLFYRSGNNNNSNRYLYYNGSNWVLYNGTSERSVLEQLPASASTVLQANAPQTATDYNNTYTQNIVASNATKTLSINSFTTTKDITKTTITKTFAYSVYSCAKNLTFTMFTITSNVVPTSFAPSFAFTTSEYSSIREITLSEIVMNYGLSEVIALNTNYDSNPQKTFTVTTAQRQPTGFTTYMPIRITESGDSDYDSSNPYKASLKNTGYIIAGGNFYTTSGNGTRVGDIRVSRYDKTNISSYDTSDYTTLYTVDGTGNRKLASTDLSKFMSFNDSVDAEGNTISGAKTQFDAMIGSSADGLHFMNAEISINNILTVPQVTILNRTYYNYQFPEDCIDFKVLKRGAISFFAGEYFGGNNAFFSLHQIFRDSNQNITDIKEIQYVYKAKGVQLGNADYIYLYKGGTELYGIINQETGNFEVTNKLSLTQTNSAYLNAYYEIAFNTDWITNPTGVSDSNKHVYYFEIPCNKGEYALGSVSGKTGAYLLYLDIAANGGDEVAAIVSGEGNAVSTTFKVDFRAPGEISNFAILQLEVMCPEETNASSRELDSRLFSVRVFFDSSETGANNTYPSGIYNIYVTNKIPDKTVKIKVYLVDDDNDVSTAFPYAFRVIYTNTEYNNVTITNIADLDFYQSVGAFEIPFEGAGVEASYD